jgi:hypothetical protein
MRYYRCLTVLILSYNQVAIEFIIEIYPRILISSDAIYFHVQSQGMTKYFVARLQFKRCHWLSHAGNGSVVGGSSVAGKLFYSNAKF